jgi:hypothetical protein
MVTSLLSTFMQLSIPSNVVVKMAKSSLVKGAYWNMSNSMTMASCALEKIKPKPSSVGFLLDKNSAAYAFLTS